MYKKVLPIILVTIMVISCGNSNLINSKKIYQNPNKSIEQRVEALLKVMTLDEKIGQMVQAERGNISAEDIKTYNLGSILSGGGSFPGKNTLEEWQNMYNSFQNKATSTRLGIPIIYGIDAVHGNNNVEGAVIFPHNIGLGAARDKELMEKIASVTIKEVLATGANWNFAPCVAVSRDERWGRTYESYGEDKELQKLLVSSYIKGTQGDKSNKYLPKDKGVATAKHFLADGGTEFGTGQDGGIDRGDISGDEKEIIEMHLEGYKEAINEGVLSVMASFSSLNGIKMHENKLINELLKKQLGFKGFVVSDWEAIGLIEGSSYSEKLAKAVNAGVDMIMEPKDWKNAIKSLKKEVEQGKINISRIDDAVSRILYAKFKSGLFENPYANKEISNSFGSPEHREIAREAVRKSLVLLKNENKLLPFKNNSKIFVTGPGADDVGIQSGGWTLSWQGGLDDGKGIYKGTSILEGMKQKAKEKGSIIITDESESSQADVVVVVIGEKPYAEWFGDSNDLSLEGKTALRGNMEALNYAYSLNKPVVVIMLSGRPMIISKEIDKWNSFVAAWLPGSQGEGIADVLFGDYNFTGKLSVTWPLNMEQIPINIGDKEYKPLFPYGMGLNY